jgi:hypothetical protein
MGAEPGNDDRPAIAIEARMVDKRKLGCEVKAAPDTRRVVSLTHALAPISKTPITQLEAETPESQIFAMLLAEAAVDPGAADAVVLPVPRIACDGCSKRYRVIHLTEAKRLLTTIVPTSAEIDTEIRRKILLEVYAEAGLRRVRMPVRRDVGRLIDLGSLPLARR